MPDRNILEGVVVLHETLHEIHSKKLDGVIFKVDFEKAYDKVKWPFLQQALRMKGFDEAWRRQVESFTQKGSVGIKVNDDIGHYLQTHKGLRQGDPMSPILFNIVVDMLAILIGRARRMVKWVVWYLISLMEVFPSFSTLMIQSSLWSMNWPRREI